MPPPKIGGKDFGPNNVKLKVFGIRATDVVPPNVWFGVLCLIFVVLLALVVVNVRRSGTGRRFLTVRGNERAAAAAGVSVAGTKMLAFGLSAFVAGLGGVLSGYRFGSVTPLYFGALNSLLFLAFAYLGGISSVMGAILAGTLAPNGVTFTAFEKWFNLDPKYVPAHRRRRAHLHRHPEPGGPRRRLQPGRGPDPPPRSGAGRPSRHRRPRWP